MKKFYKLEAESIYGEGIVYIEFDEEYATRQVEQYGSKFEWATVKDQSDVELVICDQPLSILEIEAEFEISEEEFNKVWNKAIKNASKIL